MVSKGLCGGRSAARSMRVHDHRHRRFQPRPAKAEGRSPFVRLHELLADIKPGKPAINLSVGEPQHADPAVRRPGARRRISTTSAAIRPTRAPTASARPPPPGSAAATSLRRPLDPETEVIVLNGTREGLFLGAIAAKRYVRQRAGKPAILIPNPFYAAYSAGAAAAECEPVYLPTTRETGFLPDLDAIERRAAGAHRRVLPRLAVQPAGRGRRRRLSHAARRAGAPLRLPDFRRRVLLRDLSQRPAAARHAGSVGPGLRQRRRVPLAVEALEPARPARRLRRRRPPLPHPLRRAAQHRGAAGAGAAQEVAIAAYGDEAHVEKNRELYVAKFDLADQIIGDRYGYKRPAGGFFLWLDVSAQGGDEAVAAKLWRDGGLRVIPGHYLARDGADGRNPGTGYIRVALVQDKETTAEALHRLVAVLG